MKPFFKQQRAINQVRQRIFHQVLEGAVGTLNSCLKTELNLFTISTNIGNVRNYERNNGLFFPTKKKELINTHVN